MNPKDTQEMASSVESCNMYLSEVTSVLVGNVVQIQTRNGSVFKGVLGTVLEPTNIVLERAYEIEISTESSLGVVMEQRQFSFCYKEITSIAVVETELVAEGFPTDAMISQFNGEVPSRELEPWVSAGSVGECKLGEAQTTGWHPETMFNYNEEMFGVQSTFDPTLVGYTTPLLVDDSNEYREVEAQASQIALEITQDSSHKYRNELENCDDEVVVQPTNKKGDGGRSYLPHVKKKYPQVQIPPPRFRNQRHYPAVGNETGASSRHYRNQQQTSNWLPTDAQMRSRMQTDSQASYSSMHNQRQFMSQPTNNQRRFPSGTPQMNHRMPAVQTHIPSMHNREQATQRSQPPADPSRRTNRNYRGNRNWRHNNSERHSHQVNQDLVDHQVSDQPSNESRPFRAFNSDTNNSTSKRRWGNPQKKLHSNGNNPLPRSTNNQLPSDNAPPSDNKSEPNRLTKATNKENPTALSVPGSSTPCSSAVLTHVSVHTTTQPSQQPQTELASKPENPKIVGTDVSASTNRRRSGHRNSRRPFSATTNNQMLPKKDSPLKSSEKKTDPSVTLTTPVGAKITVSPLKSSPVPTGVAVVRTPPLEQPEAELANSQTNNERSTKPVIATRTTIQTLVENLKHHGKPKTFGADFKPASNATKFQGRNKAMLNVRPEPVVMKPDKQPTVAKRVTWKSNLNPDAKEFVQFQHPRPFTAQYPHTSMRSLNTSHGPGSWALQPNNMTVVPQMGIHPVPNFCYQMPPFIAPIQNSGILPLQRPSDNEAPPPHQSSHEYTYPSPNMAPSSGQSGVLPEQSFGHGTEYEPYGPQSPASYSLLPPRPITYPPANWSPSHMIPMVGMPVPPSFGPRNPPSFGPPNPQSFGPPNPQSFGPPNPPLFRPLDPYWIPPQLPLPTFLNTNSYPCYQCNEQNCNPQRHMY